VVNFVHYVTLKERKIDLEQKCGVVGFRTYTTRTRNIVTKFAYFLLPNTPKIVTEEHSLALSIAGGKRVAAEN